VPAPSSPDHTTAPAPVLEPAAGPELSAEIAACTGNWETTREMMEPLIDRPKMMERLLGRPPFRFLQDTFHSVEKATGFGAALYDKEEADKANGKEIIKEKQAGGG